MGIFGSMYVGTEGLKTAQNAINVVANNLANVDTEGYVRQQVLQADKEYTMIGYSSGISNKYVGSGVAISDVVHTRDYFLDKYYRSESGRKAFYETSYEVTSQVQSMLQESDGKQFADTLTDFWEAFEELAKNPSAAVNQNLVVQKATLLIARAQDVYDNLTNYQNNLNVQVKDTVAEINSIGEQISKLNKQISKIESNGLETATDLRDQRDVLLDNLGELGSITYSEDMDGIVKVKFEGVQFVDESRSFAMQATYDSKTGYYTPTWEYLSDYEAGNIVEVFDLSVDISTAMNTDIGKLKSLVINRGTEESDYLDVLGVDADTFNDTTGLSTLQIVEAELDQLINQMVITINDTFSPLTELSNFAEAGADGTITLYDENGVAKTFDADVLVWDEENGALGSSKTGPGEELFSRKYVDRYTTYTDASGHAYYVYNEPQEPEVGENATLKQQATLYSLGNITVNQTLLEDETNMPAYTSNDAVDMALGAELSALWNDSFLYLNGNFMTSCTFKEYYTSMVNQIANLGSVYGSVDSTLTNSVESIGSSRSEVLDVSSDEELSNMIRFQSAYNASSRYITVINDMIETLLSIQ